MEELINDDRRALGQIKNGIYRKRNFIDLGHPKATRSESDESQSRGSSCVTSAALSSGSHADSLAATL